MGKPQLKVVETVFQGGFIHGTSEETLNSVMNVLNLIEQLQLAELEGKITLSPDAKYAVNEITSLAAEAVENEYYRAQ